MARVVFTAPLGFLVAFALFMGMRWLIADGRASIQHRKTTPLDFVTVEPDREPERIRRQPPQRPELQPTPELPAAHRDVASHDVSGVETGDGVFALGDGAGFQPRQGAGPLGIDQSVLMPVYRANPSYPRQALERGTEGYVTVRFCVDETGRVDSPRIVEAFPPDVFERAALISVSKWRYSPQRIEGQAVRRCPPPVRIVFELGD